MSTKEERRPGANELGIEATPREPEWLDARKFVAWLRENGLTHPERQLGPNGARNIIRWTATGGAVNVDTADRTLLALDRSVSELPDSLWCGEPQWGAEGARPRRSASYYASVRSEVVRARLEGVPQSVLMERYGVSRGWVLKWTKRAKELEKD